LQSLERLEERPEPSLAPLQSTLDNIRLGITQQTSESERFLEPLQRKLDGLAQTLRKLDEGRLDGIVDQLKDIFEKTPEPFLQPLKDRLEDIVHHLDTIDSKCGTGEDRDKAIAMAHELEDLQDEVKELHAARDRLLATASASLSLERLQDQMKRVLTEKAAALEEVSKLKREAEELEKARKKAARDVQALQAGGMALAEQVVAQTEDAMTQAERLLREAMQKVNRGLTDSAFITFLQEQLNREVQKRDAGQMATFCLEEAKKRYEEKKQVKALVCLQECQRWLDQMDVDEESVKRVTEANKLLLEGMVMADQGRTDEAKEAYEEVSKLATAESLGEVSMLAKLRVLELELVVKSLWGRRPGKGLLRAAQQALVKLEQAVQVNRDDAELEEALDFCLTKVEGMGLIEILVGHRQETIRKKQQARDEALRGQKRD